MSVWVAVAVLGALGALARFHVDAAIGRRSGREFPLGTLVVNGSGCLALGIVTGIHVTGDTLLLVGTAPIGAYTTVSTWMLETERLGEDGEKGLALLNVGISLAVGAGLAGLGWTVGASL
jgi:CrcB protein